MPLDVNSPDIRELIRLAVREDLGTGDVTSEATVPADAAARADVMARADGVIAGLPLVAPVVAAFSGGATVTLEAKDGDRVTAGTRLAVIAGSARGILAAERTVLNFLQRLSGVATLTRRYVDAIAETCAKIYDTRKTTPGWRTLEKYAVRCGGGENHRIGLYDQVLIKDNHLAMMRTGGAASLAELVETIRTTHPGILIEMEADTLDDLREAVQAKVDIVLLDNMTPAALAAAVQLAEELAGKDRPILEASGGVNLSTVRDIAESGVDRISVGALTHSATALDVAIDFETEGAAP